MLGSGKSAVGNVLAAELGWAFVEGDDFHPPANVEKMHNGIPLTDEDRAPWLDELARLIDGWRAKDEDAVLACSALKRDYRAQLGFEAGVLYLYLKGTREELTERLRNRRGHFAGLDLLESQLSTLQEPGPDEPAITAPISSSPEAIVESVIAVLQKR